MYAWYDVLIQVSEIPMGSEFLPVSTYIDFGSVLGGLGEKRPIDERTICLYRVAPDGREIEEPIQFSSTVRPRHPERRLLPDTPTHVSWAAEWPADKASPNFQVAGILTWIIRDGHASACSYRLKFGVPLEGTVTQVPFPPYNLRHFDKNGQPVRVRWFPRMQIRPQWPLEGEVGILIDGKLLTSYHTGPMYTDVNPISFSARRPYFYPVYGPDGICLTELGKPHDPTGSHAHHYSLWVGHASVGGADFWSERGGTIRHEQFELMEDGPLFARLIQRNRWVVGDKTHLCERRQLTVYVTPERFRLIDIELDLFSDGSEPVELGKTPFGLLAARVAQSMTVFDGAGEIVNALGQRNEQQAHWQSAPWIDQSGPVAPDRWGGIAIFDHPDNPGYPTAWHCRNDGWTGAAFNLTSAWTIEPVDHLRLRYRVHLHRHDAIQGEVSRRYEEYACQPSVRVFEVNYSGGQSY